MKVIERQFAEVFDDFVGWFKLVGGVGIGYGDGMHACGLGGFAVFYFLFSI